MSSLIIEGASPASKAGHARPDGLRTQMRAIVRAHPAEHFPAWL